MESRGLRDLRAAIASGRLAPVYYIQGDDEYRRDDLVRQLTEAAVEPATRDFNLDVLRGGDVDAERLASLLNTPPMMASRRCVVVRDAGGLRKDVRSVIERFVQQPAPDTVLVLVASGGGRDEGAPASGATEVTVARLAGDELEAWIVDHARAVHGAEVLPEAAAALAGSLRGDTAQLAAEVDKLASYTRGQPIDVAAVEAVVGEDQRSSLGTLLDRIAARDLAGALALVDPVLAQPRTTVVSVIMALTVQALAMSWGWHARARGLPVRRLYGEFMSLLKSTGAFVGQSWGEAVGSWTRHLDAWDGESLAASLHALRLADQGAKDSRVSSDQQLLSTLICSMCTPADAIVAS